MFLLRRPSREIIDRFIRGAQTSPLSYAPVGIVETAPARYNLDEVVVAIGHGRMDFERARAALNAWTQFNIGWVEVFPRQAPLEAGTVVAVLIRHLGFWSLNGCRLVHASGGCGPDDRTGFVYGTLTNHAQAGEELFEVSMNPRTGEVMYRIRAVSRPRVALTRLGYPIVRLLQARFRRDSAAAMARATSGHAARP